MLRGLLHRSAGLRAAAGMETAARRFSSLATPPPVKPGWRPVRKIMAANRGEIAIRIFRAAHELGIETVAIYSKEDFGSMHRYKADEAFCVGRDKSPIGAYLSAEEIVEVAAANSVDAIHPGYGFLSENTKFVELCEQAGIAFVGPPSKVIQRFGDKTEARALAREFDVPIVPGTEAAVTSLEEAEAFCNDCGFPVIIKAAFGGGGRGMRVVQEASDLKQAYESASNEALTAFGDGSVFIERYVNSPRHVEVCAALVDVAACVCSRFPARLLSHTHARALALFHSPSRCTRVRGACACDRARVCRTGPDSSRRQRHGAPLRERLQRAAAAPKGGRGRTSDRAAR
jgi:D-alanine-D-alanine ligase-like ATP-grasp enzyme